MSVNKMKVDSRLTANKVVGGGALLVRILCREDIG